ncbi:MAG TPA: hypothetical protein VKB94_03230, partial [Rhizomicrobium sp.]|nr:hypothetical protein [Rhizomicrobium sp.]
DKQWDEQRNEQTGRQNGAANHAHEISRSVPAKQGPLLVPVRDGFVVRLLKRRKAALFLL